MAFIEPFPYYPATIVSLRTENDRCITLGLEPVDHRWIYRAGQHCVFRLTDERGYIAARDYSLSSAPSSNTLELTVQKAKAGEVSTWVHERLSIGDTVQLSDPLGKDFSWSHQEKAPLLLIAGGIGIAPLMSILREHRISQTTTPIHLAYSVRTADDLCFVTDLIPTRNNEKIFVTLTRQTATTNYSAGRLDADKLRPLAQAMQKVFICGPTQFVDSMEKIVHRELHVPADQILTERFG